jgi:CO/xanthine dehydrogenase Mo-binding subunit
MLVRNQVSVTLTGGAYPLMAEETGRRMRAASQSLYRVEEVRYSGSIEPSAEVPRGPFEGLGTAQVSFAREIHYSRLAELAQQDPIVWRRHHLRQDWPILTEILTGLAEESDFHRKYAANELIRKRRLQLPRNSRRLKGIGCALAEQVSGFTGEREVGSIAVQLNAGGTARLSCSVPSPTPRLQLAWRQMVANELGLEVGDVQLDATYEIEAQNSGPRLLSRGVSVVPRTIQSVCQAIQKQRFREPLPIEVRRSMRMSRAASTPAHALHGAGAAAAEVVLLPGSMQIEISSVTLVVYAGRILDRGAAEAELRRGIYQALGWTLHEEIDEPTDLTAVPSPFPYRRIFSGSPRIRISFETPEKRDGPTGLGELPFSTVPAAVVAALSQASGLYLDAMPVRAGSLLEMLQEE